MADAPPNSADEKPQNPVSQGVQPANHDSQDTKVEPVKETSPTSVFVNSEPIREEQVQNAVKFLSHPKVRGSPVIYRRSFLERKGLTKEEIDEAFRRVPDPTPSATATQTVVTTQDGQVKSSSNVQQQPPAQVAQPTPTGPVSSISKWGHSLDFTGITLFLLWGFWLHQGLEQQYFLRKKYTRNNAVEEQEIEGFQGPLLGIDAHTCFLVFQQPYVNGKADTDSHSVRSLSPPSSAEPSVPPHPKSYMEEINDAPPNPNQPVSNPRLAPRPKPWEVGQAQSSSVNAYPTQESSNSSAYEYPDNQLNGDDAAPWWQRKNVRITEIEAGEEQKRGSSNVLANEQPARRSWVPPQPPPVVMPEAAAAIRQPKKASYQTEQLTDDQLLARAADGTDELQRITKFSESGGALEANGESSGLHSTEMPNGENGTYLEA
ncbi:UNVERIFIED_CONTAM: Peroxisomal membrane protein PEX14 [Sesamum angustifolium]|uniref:Peroxisomal membrane protein PEX14 n=1 Tax=Sesamum angustifolium TaxID=2727405 RepID=A0AAW2LH07_9LAMI